MTALPDGLELRPIAEDELEQWGRQVSRQFGEDFSSEDLAYYRDRRGSDIERTYGIYDAGRLVGTGANFSFRMTVPGGAQLGCAGVSGIGVQTTHRRRGLLRAMMRELTDDATRRHEPLAALLASESSIYGRFGFGPAIPLQKMELRHPYIRLARPVEAVVEMPDVDDAVTKVPQIYDRVQRAQHGMIAPPDQWWPVWLRQDPSSHREGFSERYIALYEDRGFVRYRIKPDWGDTGADGILRVEALIAADPDAATALWQYCFSVDLITQVEAYRRPTDDPLPYQMVEPVRVRRTIDEPIYLRLVDVPAALGSRAYATDDVLALGVRDAFCPDNEATWLLESSGGRAHCEQTGRVPDLTLDVEDLATVYLGGVRVSQLVRAGRIAERVPGIAARADAMLATDPLPWQPWGF